MQVSFRDPDGFVVRHEGRVYRYVFPHAVEQVRSFLSSRAAAKWILEGALAGTAILSEPHASLPGSLRDELPSGGIVLEHQPLPFTNYPHEWPAEMLHAAAIRTISMAVEALEEGFVLKDATPYNVMFNGPKAVFLDVLSFERREPRDPLWRPYAQFVRTFLYPLLVYRDLDIAPGETLALHRDGLNTEQVAKMLPGMRRFLPPRLGLVAIPAFLSRKKASDNPEQFRERKTSDEGEARFLLRRVLDRAMKLSHRFAPAQKPEALAYETENSYSASELAVKDAALSKAISSGSRVLDIGCNTGRYSILAAKQGAGVVAIDRDAAAVGALWRRAAAQGLDILPLVVDIGAPTGASGWGNREHLSFLERSRGKFDCVLMLALIHHLIVMERVPLDSTLDLLSELTTDAAVVEYVDPSDSQFQRLVRGRQALHANLTSCVFESTAKRRFEIIESCDVTPTRKLYFLKRKLA